MSINVSECGQMKPQAREFTKPALQMARIAK